MSLERGGLNLEIKLVKGSLSIKLVYTAPINKERNKQTKKEEREADEDGDAS